ncbi:MAG: hypothetical protein HQ483_21350 [Rhodospirillales bacterium]|nr:hypothetical protein [Rhodospirillales bacterium]
MDSQRSRPRWAIPIAIFVGIFGALSLKSGGEVLFIDGAGRAAAGNYLPSVVWFNFLAGFAYIAGAVGLARWRPWVAPLAFTIAILTCVVFVALGAHISMGGAFEVRTVGAMTLRSLVWIGVAVAVRRRFMVG